MSSAPRPSTTHIERTAKEPRDTSLHKVILSSIQPINPQIRLLRLSIPTESSPVKFLPGQWLDVHIPGLPKPGGFTITSTPLEAQPSQEAAAPSETESSTTSSNAHSNGYLELAIQNQPLNPAAAWLWRPVSEILNQELKIRVGGSFVWPPPDIDVSSIKRVVFIAGGVGVNPLMSIVSYLAQQSDLRFHVEFIYTLRDPGGERKAEEMLFVERLGGIFLKKKSVKGNFVLYLTPGQHKTEEPPQVPVNGPGWSLDAYNRRISKDDVVESLGAVEDRHATVAYICGVPTMTDEFVDVAQKAEGMNPKNVLFERWW